MSEQQPVEPASPSDPPAGALPPHPGPVPPQYAGQAPPSPPSPSAPSGQGQPAHHPAPGQAAFPSQPQVPYPGQHSAPGPYPGQFASPGPYPGQYSAPGPYPGQYSAPGPAALYPGPGQYPAHPEAPTFAAPYASPAQAAYVAPPAAGGGAALGIVALVVGLAALIIAPTIAAFAGYSVGVGLGDELALRQSPSDIDITILAPVRDAVLWGEIAFWSGTVLGIWAIVQGIVAIVKRRGRGPGIAAVVAAALGPIAFLIVLYAFVWAGIGASGSLGW